MSIDFKPHTNPGEISVRALGNNHGDYGVSILYRYGHQEKQAARARMEDHSVGPVLEPATAFRIGLSIILASILCGIRSLFSR